MSQNHSSRTPAVALAILDYVDAPTVAIWFAGALTYSFVTLQSSKPQKSHETYRKWTICLTLLLVAAYITQAIFVAHLSLTSHEIWFIPQHHIIRILESILLWTAVNLVLTSSAEPVWHPYIGCWAIGGAFEMFTCILSPLALHTAGRYRSVAIVLGAIRIACFAALLINGFLLTRQYPIEAHSDDEEQSLLGSEPEESATAQKNNNISYGTTPTDTDNDNDSDSDDDDKKVKEQQRKRLEEEGGWVGYLKSFAVFLPYVWPKDDWRIMLCLVVMGVGIVLDRFLNVLTPRQIGIITDQLNEGTIMPWKAVLIWNLYSYLGSFAGFGLITSFASTALRNYSEKRISNLAFGHVMDLSMDFHSNKDTGEILSAVSQATSLNDLLELVLFEIGPVLIDLVVGLWYATHLFDMYMAFIILTIGLVYIWLGIVTTQWAQDPRRRFVEKWRTEGKTSYECVSNWEMVASFNRTRYERDRYSDIIQAAIDTQWTYLFISWAGYAAQSIVLTLGFTGGVMLAIAQISAGRKPVGNFVTLIMYWGTIMSPLYTMASSYRHIASTLIDAERLLQVLRTKSSVTDAPTARPLALSKGKVEFRNVHFSYDEKKEVLKDVSFVAKPGTTVAFVGETGGGKSTMLKLLGRFYDVTSGAILIDDQDLRSVTVSSLRNAFGAVPQEPSMFNQSVLENVRYARLDASEKEVQEACKAAAVHDKIMSFPGGYKSKVGERGVKLSGGEKQRLAIARVLLRNPGIVLLDEATSAVDSSTEEQIQEAFKRLSKGRTTFVVAHRLSTIMDADLILVVEGGTICERGSHEELLKKGGKYCELWTKQTKARESKKNGDEEQSVEQDLLR